jgi:hypothetical protein
MIVRLESSFGYSANVATPSSRDAFAKDPLLTFYSRRMTIVSTVIVVQSATQKRTFTKAVQDDVTLHFSDAIHTFQST